MPRGYVYVLSNTYIRGSTGAPLLKIGGTARSAHHRRQELSQHTGVPGSFEIQAEMETHNWQLLERLAHRYLRQYRRTGEFFEVNITDAIAAIETLNASINARRKAYAAPQVTISEPGGEVPSAGAFFQRAGPDLIRCYFDGKTIGHISLPSALFSGETELAGSDPLEHPVHFHLVGSWRGSDKWAFQALGRYAVSKLAPFTRLLYALMYAEFRARLLSHDQYELTAWAVPILRASLKRERVGFLFRREEVSASLSVHPEAERLFHSACPSDVAVERRHAPPCGFEPSHTLYLGQKDSPEQEIQRAALRHFRRCLFVSGMFSSADRLTVRVLQEEFVCSRTFDA
jgi:T5orf172 domain